MKQKKRFLLVLMLALAMISGRAEHTMALDLADVKTSGCTYNTESHVITFPSDSWKAAYWDLSDAMRSYTTATVTIQPTTISVRVILRYTPVGASTTSDISATIAAGQTTATVEIPSEGTLGTLRVGNWNYGAGEVTLVSAELSGLRPEYSLNMSSMGAGSGNNATYDSDTKTISFTGDGSNQYRGWSISNSYLNDYKTVVVEFAEALSFDVEFKMNYKNGSDAAKSVSKTVKQYNKRASLSIPATDINSITNIIFKTTDSTPHSLTIKKAYLTTDELAYLDIAAATNTWASTNSSYDASIQTITWTDVTRHGWWIGSADYNSYKSVVVEFVPAPVAMTGYLSYYATEADYNTNPKVVTYTDIYIPAGSTMVALPIPTTIYRMTAVMLAPVSACSLKLTDAYATSKEYENSKTITLSTTETVLEDNWASSGLTLTKEQMALAQAGDQIAVHVSALSEGNTHTAWIQNGSNQDFAGVSGVSITSASQVATFTLTEAMLNYIHGNVEGTNGGLVVKGTGYTFNQVNLIHNIYKIKGQPATNIWSGEQVIDWGTDPSQYATVPASNFAFATKDMKLRMSFKGLKLSAQGHLANTSWTNTGIPDANTYETLKSDWGNYYEFDITDAMLTELQANGMHVTGVGYTLTSVDLIDPDCEYDITSTFDTADIIAWETTNGTPNLTVTITNNEAYEITVPINIALMTDMFTDFNTYSANVTLAAGETKVTDVEFNDLTPGFYRMAANVAGNKLCTYYIGYNPTAIVSPDDSQEDFATFWGTWKERLAAIPIDAELTLLNGDTGSDTRNIYEVKYKSVPETADENAEPVYIYGYYAEPKAAGTYPCIIHFHGTSKTTELTMPSGTTEGWCEFRFSARGQTLDKAKNGSDKYRQDPNDESSVDFYAYRLGDNDEHYYRYVYLDTRRAVDFVYSQAKVNKDAVFAAGGSQGGCLTYVCAALSDGKIRAIAPSITGHADFVHTMEIVGWPTNVFNNWINANYPGDYAAGKAALLAHQSYFDTKNFAKWIYCPVITNFSLQDNTDGPHLNISPYNLLTNVAAADKQYSINQFKGHAAADNWSTTYMAFFNQYLNTPLTIPYALTVSDPGYATYYNSTATQLPSGVEAATIDAANNSENALTVNWCYNGDENEKKVIPGGTAVMVKATAGNYNLSLLPSNTTAAPTGNLLHGSDVSTTTTGGDKYYKLTYGKADGSNANNFGWYWGAADGAAFTMPAHKAWLALSSGAGTRSYFSLDGGDGTTGIGTIETKLDPDTLPEEGWYDLHGQRINKPTQKGLYILNGKKIIVR